MMINIQQSKSLGVLIAIFFFTKSTFLQKVYHSRDIQTNNLELSGYNRVFSHKHHNV